jgi:hypothetical protein
MKRGYVASIVFAILAVIVFAGLVSAHRAITYDCETVTVVDAGAGWTFDLYSNTFEGNYHFDITADGQSTFGPIRPGGYGYQFTDTHGRGRENGSVTVSECAQESPTPSPTPEVTPSPTPVPSVSPDPTPAPHRTPRPTGPPTDTE